MMNAVRAFLLSSLFLTSLLFGQEATRILVPIHSPLPTPGAFGSEWVTDFQIYNTGDDIVSIQNYGSGCSFDPCPPGGVPARTTISPFTIRDVAVDAIPGAVLYVLEPGADQLRFQLRVRDISRGAFGWGTWLPVIRESEAPAGTVHLLNLPLEEGYRRMLRVYSFREVGRVHVRVFGTDPDPFAVPEPDPLLAEFSLDLIRSFSGDPGYAQFTAFDELGMPAEFTVVRLEIVPEGAFKVWGMISITNNATQEVTGLFPN